MADNRTRITYSRHFESQARLNTKTYACVICGHANIISGVLRSFCFTSLSLESTRSYPTTKKKSPDQAGTRKVDQMESCYCRPAQYQPQTAIICMCMCTLEITLIFLLSDTMEVIARIGKAVAPSPFSIDSKSR